MPNTTRSAVIEERRRRRHRSPEIAASDSSRLTPLTRGLKFQRPTSRSRPCLGGVRLEDWQNSFGWQRARTAAEPTFEAGEPRRKQQQQHGAHRLPLGRSFSGAQTAELVCSLTPSATRMLKALSSVKAFFSDQSCARDRQTAVVPAVRFTIRQTSRTSAIARVNRLSRSSSGCCTSPITKVF